MDKPQSHIEIILADIAKYNQELQQLEDNPEEANRIVYPPARFKELNTFEITYKNQIELERDERILWLRRHLRDYELDVLVAKHQKKLTNNAIKYLAFVDILGFSEIVQKNTHEELDDFVFHLTAGIQMGLVPGENGSPKSKLYNNSYFGPDLSSASVNSILLSDTIIFWTNDDSIESFYDLVKIVGFYIHMETYFHNVALRGAITVGELSYEEAHPNHTQLVLDQSMIYGKAIVEAYRFEGLQEWIGCVVTQKAIDYFLGQSPSGSVIDEVFNKYLIKYPVPIKRTYKKLDNWTPSILKSQPIQEDYVIKWPRTIESENGLNSVKRCFTKHQKLLEVPPNPDIYRKYINTVKFAEYVIQASIKE